jgi:hypothetical protein
MIGAQERHPRQQERDAGENRHQHAEQPQDNQHHASDDPERSPHERSLRRPEEI